MSSVIVQIGQCGNQIGHDLWNYILKNNLVKASNVYSNGDGRLRSIHVDSEPKVLSQIIRDFSESLLRKENVLVGRRGRGTNWALGYYGSKNQSEDQILENSLNALRKEVERCNSFSGVITLHSLSGGTGSGLGSHLTELIRDEYPLSYIMSCVVAPHTSGESPLQHYNSILSVSWLQRFSDCVVLFHNDEIMHRVEKRHQRDAAATGDSCTDSSSSPLRSVSFQNMNKHIAACLAGVFLPTDTLLTQSGYSTGLEPWEMLRSVAPMPTNKFLHLNHHAKRKQSWENLVGQAVHYLPKHDANHRPYKSLANLVVARGDTTSSFMTVASKLESRVKSAYHCVEWNPFPVDFWTAQDSATGAKDVASVTIAANYSSVTDCLNHMSSKAAEKYKAKAYLHWYEKYGCEQTTFEESFETVNSIVREYEAAIT